MPEAYKCICNSQDFSIYNNFISCSKCGNEYRRPVGGLEPAAQFNNRIRLKGEGNLW